MGTPLREIVGVRVASLRQRANLSQGELAAKADIARVTLNRIEGGHQAPSIEFLVALADALGTTPNYLLGYAGNPERPKPRGKTQRLQPVASAG